LFETVQNWFDLNFSIYQSEDQKNTRMSLSKYS
jgi:hypothetical protein